MRDRKEACAVLGLPEEAGMEDIERRYFHLVKKYKYLGQDEQPSLGEPIFPAINKAYRYLIGYAPMEKIVFRDLGMREKWEHIRDYYKFEIALGLFLVLFVCAFTAGAYTLYHTIQQLGGTAISSKVESPLPHAYENYILPEHWNK
jgi:hypothetical protein